MPSLRNKILKEIKKYLKEDYSSGTSDMPDQISRQSCPPGKKPGTMNVDGSIGCVDMSPSEKASLQAAGDLGKKLGKGLGGGLRKGEKAIGGGLKKLLDKFGPNQSTGPCPPGQEVTGENSDGTPQCSPKAPSPQPGDFTFTGPVKGGPCRLPIIAKIQEQYNNATYQMQKPKIKVDKILGSETRKAMKNLAIFYQIKNSLIPKTCDAKAFKAFSDAVEYHEKNDFNLPFDSNTADKPAQTAEPGKPPSWTGADAGRLEPMPESKNWLNRTREKTTSNLFERLVKDAAKKKVL